MKNDIEIQKQSRKPLHRLYKVAILLIFLSFLCFLSYTFYLPDTDKTIDSDNIIRTEAAKQLNKNVDEVTDKDLQSITKFVLFDRTRERYYLLGRKLSDIKLLRKFKNLRELDLSYIQPVRGDIPKWKKVFVELGIIKIPETPLLDLKPLRKLTKLETLDLSDTEICNLEVIKNLKNLHQITFLNSNVTDLEPLRKLNNLEELTFFCKDISNIEPLKDLKYLHELALSITDVNDLSPLKEIKSLRELYISESADINKEQIKDLQKALPWLEINDSIYDISTSYF